MNEKANQKKASRLDKGFTASDKKFLIGSIVLHLIVFSLLLGSWHSSDKVRTVQIPANVQARMLSAEELRLLKQKQDDARKKVADRKKKEADLKAKKKAKAKRKKIEAQRKKKEAKRKKAAKKKKEDARKKALIREKEIKKAKEKTKAEKALKDKRRKEEDDKKRLEKQKQAQEEKQTEREKRLLEKLQAIELQNAREKKQLELERKAQQLAEDTQAALDQELSETERFMSLIRSRIESRWHIPPNSQKLSVVLRINLLPTGELSIVKVLEPSGQTAMDQSALSAVRSVRQFPVPDNKALFEKYFRRFSMSFSPEL